MPHHEHPLEALYEARQNIHTAGAELVTRQYQPDDISAYEVAAVTVLDGLYLLIDTLVEQCLSRFTVWPPPGYDRLLHLHDLLRTMLWHLHRDDHDR